jgi:phosphoribosyl-dephospho-CoA transferase
MCSTEGETADVIERTEWEREAKEIKECLRCMKKKKKKKQRKQKKRNVGLLSLTVV